MLYAPSSLPQLCPSLTLSPGGRRNPEAMLSTPPPRTLAHTQLRTQMLARCRRSRSPFRRGVLAAQRVPELHRGPTTLSEQPPTLACVVLHQLGQRRELLPSIQIVVVTCVLDLDVGHLIVAPGRASAPPPSGPLLLPTTLLPMSTQLSFPNSPGSVPALTSWLLPSLCREQPQPRSGPSLLQVPAQSVSRSHPGWRAPGPQCPRGSQDWVWWPQAWWHGGLVAKAGAACQDRLSLTPDHLPRGSEGQGAGLLLPGAPCG